MASQAERTLRRHLKALQAIFKDMDKSNVAYKTVKGRIEECKQAITAVRGD